MLSEVTHEELSSFVKHLDELEKHNNEIYNHLVKEIEKHFDETKSQEKLEILRFLIDTKRQQIDYHIDDLSKVHPNLEKHINSLLKLKETLDNLESTINNNAEKIILNKKEYMKYANALKEIEKKRFKILKDAIKETHKKGYLKRTS
jgi:chromosome segregation ATPase